MLGFQEVQPAVLVGQRRLLRWSLPGLISLSSEFEGRISSQPLCRGAAANQRHPMQEQCPYRKFVFVMTWLTRVHGAVLWTSNGQAPDRYNCI
jgi:hypothetical protein